MREVVVVPPDPLRWQEAFESEAVFLRGVFGENLVELHHIGSTAISGVAAKPIVDMLPEVRDIAGVDERNDAMVAAGYQVWGEFGLPGRRYFSKDQNGERTHNVHVYERGNPEVERHLAFRDYMNAHPEETRLYGNLKVDLAQRFRWDFEAYMDGKDEFIKERERRALAWRRAAK